MEDIELCFQEEALALQSEVSAIPIVCVVIHGILVLLDRALDHAVEVEANCSFVKLETYKRPYGLRVYAKSWLVPSLQRRIQLRATSHSASTELELISQERELLLAEEEVAGKTLQPQ